MKPVSPWAEVQPEETLPTLAPPASASSVWAEPQGVDLHAGLKPIAAPAPQPSPAMGKLPAAMEPQTDPIAMQPQTDPVAMPAQKAEAPQTIKSRLNSKLERDYEKDANPWGSPDNHPGFFGKLAHALNHATGGDTRRQWEENGLVHQINAQQAAEDQSAEKTAETAKTAQETERLKNPIPKEGVTPEEKAVHDLTQQVNPDTGKPYTYFDGYQKVMQAKQDTKPEKSVVQPHITYDAGIPVSVTGPNGVWDVNDPKLPPELKPLVDAANRAHGQHTTEAEASQSRVAANAAAAQARAFAHADQNSGHKGSAEILKAYQPTLDSAERMNVMTENYEKAIKDHDQQAMLSLLANHLGMTMGLQKGARLTKDIIHEAQQSQPWLQGVAAKFDKDGYLSGVTLSPNQMRQMVGLGQSRYAEDAKKSRSTAQYLGAKDDGPERHPGTATKNYYLGAAGGDRSKAMQLMVNDGWTVPNGR